MVEIKKIEGWENIVRDLKKGPDFGIHGPSGELETILDESRREGTMEGHYFVVSNDQKERSNEDFYNGLWRSLNSALIFSHTLESDPPYSIILGMEKKPSGIIHPIQAQSPMYVDGGKTFEIGHDFIFVGDAIELIGLRTSREELEEIDDRFYLKNKRGQPYEDIVKHNYRMGIIIPRMIKEIHREVIPT